MLELLKELLEYLPRYLAEFFRVLSGPRMHIGGIIDTEPELAWRESLFFVAISYSIVLLMNWAAQGETNELPQTIVADVLLTILKYAVSGLILLGVLRLFGARGDTIELLTVFSYWLGVMILIGGVFLLVQLGGMKMFDPDFYRMTVNLGNSTSLREMEGIMATQGIAFTNPRDPAMHQFTYNFIVAINTVGATFEVIWTGFCWSIYRERYNLTWGKIIAVFLLWNVFDTFNPISMWGYLASNVWN